MWCREWVRLPTSCDQGLPVEWSKDILCRAGNSQQYWCGCFTGLFGWRPTTRYGVGLFGKLNLFTNQLASSLVIALEILTAINPLTANFRVRFKAQVRLAKERLLGMFCNNSHLCVSELKRTACLSSTCSTFQKMCLRFAFGNVTKGTNTSNGLVTAASQLSIQTSWTLWLLLCFYPLSKKY